MFSRAIPILNEQTREAARKMLAQLPVDGSIEVVARTRQKKRTNDQNAYYWLRLTEISEQAWIGGRQYSPEVLHEYMKREYLPETIDPDLETLVKNPEKYRKWTFLPTGDRICVGSSTNLTKRGFAEYVTAIEAYAAQELGVMFSAGPQWQ